MGKARLARHAPTSPATHTTHLQCVVFMVVPIASSFSPNPSTCMSKADGRLRHLGPLAQPFLLWSKGQRVLFGRHGEQLGPIHSLQRQSRALK